MGTTSDDTKWKRIAGLGGVGLLLVAGFAWWLTPEPEAVPRTVRTVQTLQTNQVAAKRKVVRLPAPEPEDDDLLADLEDDPNIEVVTPNCRTIVKYERRGVPQFSIMDTLRDQSMRFDEKDLGCLTAAGVSPGILDLAEQRVDYNALRGIKGTPGRDLTDEHETFFTHPRNRDQ